MAIFSFLTIMKTVIRNTFLHVPCTFFIVTYRYPLRSGNAGSQGSWMCNFIQLSHIAFPKWLYWFTFPAAMFQRYYWSTFSSILSVVQLLFSDWMDVQCHLIVHRFAFSSLTRRLLNLCVPTGHTWFCFCFFLRKVCLCLLPTSILDYFPSL